MKKIALGMLNPHTSLHYLTKDILIEQQDKSKTEEVKNNAEKIDNTKESNVWLFMSKEKIDIIKQQIKK